MVLKIPYNFHDLAGGIGFYVLFTLVIQYYDTRQ